MPKFGVVPREVPVTRSLDVLAPKFRAALELVLADMRAAGHTPLVVETLRTDERQRFLYGFGRTYDDGRGRVTFSQSASETWHGYGLAADVVCADRRWGATDAFWADLGRFARARGLRWGADWDHDGETADESFTDRPHLQWGPPMRRSPSPRALELRQRGGLVAVWKEVGAAAEPVAV
jgi:hypothetical protein